MTKKPFPRNETTFEMLEIVHFDICELNGQLLVEEIDILSLSLMIILDLQMFIWWKERSSIWDV